MQEKIFFVLSYCSMEYAKHWSYEDIEKVMIWSNILSKPSFCDLRERLKTTRNTPMILSSIKDLLDNIFHKENPFVTYAWLIY